MALPRLEHEAERSRSFSCTRVWFLCVGLVVKQITIVACRSKARPRRPRSPASRSCHVHLPALFDSPSVVATEPSGSSPPGTQVDTRYNRQKEFIVVYIKDADRSPCSRPFSAYPRSVHTSLQSASDGLSTQLWTHCRLRSTWKQTDAASPLNPVIQEGLHVATE